MPSPTRTIAPCSVFFRKILIDNGEDPDHPNVTEAEQALIDFGRAIARTPSAIKPEFYARLESTFNPQLRVLLVAFAGQMVATNLFVTVGKVPLDEVLYDYRKPGDERTGETDRPFARRVAFITGAAHGQGRAVALALAESGADIVALDVAAKIEYPAYAQGSSAEARLSLVAEVHALGRRALAFVGDVCGTPPRSSGPSMPPSPSSARIDVLFNNAGIVAYAATADEMTELEWDAMIDVNLKGPFLVARSVIPIMKAQRSGVIINNSSVMGLRGGNRLSHYVASKHGLTGLTKAWAIELAPWGIRVVSIHPTGVNTPMNDGLAELEGATAIEITERSAGNLLPGVPWIEASDVAELVLYLASDRARYATGAQFTLDAGLLTR